MIASPSPSDGQRRCEAPSTNLCRSRSAMSRPPVSAPVGPDGPAKAQPKVSPWAHSPDPGADSPWQVTVALATARPIPSLTPTVQAACLPSPILMPAPACSPPPSLSMTAGSATTPLSMSPSPTSRPWSPRQLTRRPSKARARVLYPALLHRPRRGQPLAGHGGLGRRTPIPSSTPTVQEACLPNPIPMPPMAASPSPSPSTTV